MTGRSVKWPKFSEIGDKGNLCPYCSRAFERRPVKLSKCRDCGGQVYIRTRPFDGLRVLLRDSDLQVLENEWVICREVTGARLNYQIDKVLWSEAKERLVASLGRSPSLFEIGSLYYEERLSEFESKRRGSGVRFVILSLAIVAAHDGMFDRAIQGYLNVCYIDMSGSMGAHYKNSLEGPPVARVSQIAPGVLARLITLAARRGWDESKLRDSFIYSGERLFKKMPVYKKPDVIWPFLADVLFCTAIPLTI